MLQPGEKATVTLAWPSARHLSVADEWTGALWLRNARYRVFIGGAPSMSTDLAREAAIELPLALDLNVDSGEDVLLSPALL